MGDNYKVIRRCREAVAELKSQGWAVTKIAKTINISNAVVIDLETMDEVAMNLRQPTVDKMRKFVDGFEKAKQHIADQKKKVEPTFSSPDNAPIIIKKEKKEELRPKLDPVKKKPYESSPGLGAAIGLLDDLQELSKRFAIAGYRLDASLTLIKYPEQ